MPESSVKVLNKTRISSQSFYLLLLLLLLLHSLTLPLFLSVFLILVLVSGTVSSKGTRESLFFETVSLLVRMMRTGLARPDEFTFPLVMKVCSKHGKVSVGSSVHGLILRIGCDKDLFVGTSFVDFYGKCKELLSARKVFGEMPERNAVTWTALIDAYVKSGELEEARKMFELVPDRNPGLWNALLMGLLNPEIW